MSYNPDLYQTLPHLHKRINLRPLSISVNVNDTYRSTLLHIAITALYKYLLIEKKSTYLEKYIYLHVIMLQNSSLGKDLLQI